MPDSSKSPRRILALVAAAVLFLAACSDDDDGAQVRDVGGGSEDGSSSSSGSGISADDVAQSTDNALIQQAVDGYRAYVQEQIAAIQAETAVFADAVRAGDIEAAKAAFPISRRPWERIEPIAALIEDIDGAVDAREDDFDGPTDDGFTGWHRLEYHLWTLGDVSDVGHLADKLEADLQILADTAGTLDLPPGVLTVGAQELIEEVAAPDGKLSGEEDRYSGTDLYDFLANVEGSEALVDLLAPALEEADPDLLATVRAHFEELYSQLGDLGSFEAGFVHYDEVTEEQKTAFANTLGELAESLSLLNGTLGLD